MPAHSVLTICPRLGTGTLPGPATTCQAGGMAQEWPAALRRYLVMVTGSPVELSMVLPLLRRAVSPQAAPYWPLCNLFFVRTWGTCVSFCCRADPVLLGGP